MVWIGVWERVWGGFGEGTNSLNLVFVEVGHAVDDYPGEGAAEVDHLVHDERHDARREDIVLHVCVPSLFICQRTISQPRGREQRTAQRRSNMLRVCPL